jgi:hypothetical protein
VTADLPGEHGRPLAMRSQDDRGPAYTAAVERSEATFAAVRAVLGDRPRLAGNAGELAALAAALPPETSLWIADWPRIERGQQPGPGWVEAVGATMATVVERPLMPVRDNAGREHDVMAPAVELGAFLLPGPDAEAPQDTEASGYYARAVEALETAEGPGVSLTALAALVHHIAGLADGDDSPARYLPRGSPAAADIGALAAELRGVAVALAAVAPAAAAEEDAEPDGREL